MLLTRGRREQGYSGWSDVTTDLIHQSKVCNTVLPEERVAAEKDLFLEEALGCRGFWFYTHLAVALAVPREDR